jgi:hypothetical protein
VGDIETVVAGVDAARCLTKESRENTKSGRILYSPVDLNATFKRELAARGWTERRTSYYVTDDEVLILKTMRLPPEEQKARILAAGKTPIFSFNQTDFVKDRVEIEVQFGKYPFVAYDLFVKQLAFFNAGDVDAAVDIIPVASLANELCEDCASYEKVLADVVGKVSPPMPIVLVGVEP